jgi:penicillin-binding protein 1A
MFLDSSNAHETLNLTVDQFMENFDSLYNLNKEEYDTLPDSTKLRIVQASVFAIDVITGAIKVCTGGRDYNESKFNRALQARRQPGSAFKPFVYTVAIDSNFTPASVIMDQPITLETPEGLWRPENYDRKFYGPVSLRHALNRSINLVAIQVLLEVGVYNVINYVRKAGLQHEMRPVPSLAIGSCEATNYEMTLAYSVYANHGVQPVPYCIEKIYDRNGRLLESHKPERKKILSSSTAYIMASLLTSVVRAGTGASSIQRGFTRIAGGKTGTTNDYSDAWFVGFTPQIACGVWVGVDERRSMGHGVTGSRGAIPIWTETMKALHRDLPPVGFGRPETIRSERICKETYKVATDYCPDTYNEIFSESDSLETCDEHGLNRGRSTKDIRQRLGSDKKSGGTSSKSPLVF